MKQLFILFLTVILIPFVGLSQNGLTFESYSGVLSNIDLTTANQTVIATTETQINAADFGPDNVLFGINSSTNQLIEIDTATGSTTTIATIALSNRVWSGLAYDIEHDVMYGMSVVGEGTPASSLYAIDVEDGALTLIGTQTTATSIGCIGINEYTGGLYGLDLNDDAGIYLIDRYDGSVTLVGETGLNCSGYGYGMDYSLEDSSMYLTTFNDQSFVQNSLRIVDLTDGSTTVVGEINDVTGALTIPIVFEATFTSDISTVCMGGLVFYSNETFGATEWEWEFEGGNPSSSTSQNPIIRYNDLGTFDVTLIVSNENNSDTLTIEDYMAVVETPGEPNEPMGDDTGIPDSTAQYTVEEVEYAAIYIWTLTPEEAGAITGDSLVATVIWASDYVGEAEVAVSAENVCGTSPSSVPHTVMVEPLGVDKNQSNNIKVYPNPANNILNINFKNIKSNEVTIELFSAQGVAVLNYKVSNTENETNAEFDISKLANGVYYLVIKSDDSIIKTEKVLKF